LAEHPVIEPRRKGRSGTQSMLIPSRGMVAAALHDLPGEVSSGPGVVRRALAQRYGADACCPVTLTRQLVAISADGDAPFWRAVDPERTVARRTAGGADFIRNKLAQERG
jgi:hypothetical protein